ncbi:transcription factor bHLH18-like [Canna indica]|uniref:Transcription factor bHLH18-like n=1 Tax=Canna indica TaxID=4628 RepID=A0AAQ3QC24_9LILI|nr:transcription factor bHLH18-like [Canna indica]
METLASPYYSDMGMDHSFFDQLELTALDQFEMALGQDLKQSPSSESYTSYPSADTPRRKKMAKTSSWSSCTTEHKAGVTPDASGPKFLSFGNSRDDYSNFYGGALAAKPKEEFEVLIPSVSKRTRTTSHNQEHIMAERKRREKLSQRFIALSAIVPDLKKDQVAKRNVESAVLVKKSQLCADDDDSFSDESHCGESLPEIEARVCEKSILIKIHCENQKGVLVRALSEIEKLHLSVLNTSVIPFTGSSLDITVMGQASHLDISLSPHSTVEEDFSMTAKDVVKKLNSAFRQFTG